MESSDFFDSLESLFHISSSQPHPKHTHWTFEENKLFENALAELNLDSPDFLEKIALKIPTKTIQQIEEHYKALVEDVMMIESGCVPLPDYKTTERVDNAVTNNSTPQPRKRGVPWTNEEHENFLTGLERYGKGDWKSISRVCVRTRNPTQVASHAQKYFLKLERWSSKSNSGLSDASSSDQYPWAPWSSQI